MAKAKPEADAEATATEEPTGAAGESVAPDASDGPEQGGGASRAQQPGEPAVPADSSEVEDFTPAGGALVVSDPSDTVAVLQVLDRHDEMQILERLQGKLSEKHFYSFPMEGRQITELSVSGVFDTVNEMNQTGKVKVAIDRSRSVEWERERLDTDFAADVEHIVATVYAVDEVTGIGAWGTYSQPLKFKLTERTAQRRKRDQKYVPEDGIMSDPFARQKALNKAERNALRKLVPEVIAQTLIAQREGDSDRIQRIKAGPGAAGLAELPPPLTDERAEAQRVECRRLMDEIRAIDPVAYILPGQFNAMLTRAEWSHERLAELVETLQGILDKAQAEAAEGGKEK